MSDTVSRNPRGAPQMLADALLRNAAGAPALFRVTGANPGTNTSEVGLVAATFADVPVSPAVMRRVQPALKEGGQARWELLVSATGVEQQVNALNLASAQSLFSMTLAVTMGEQDYLIEAISANEAFGQVYLYRLLLREARAQAV